MNTTQDISPVLLGAFLLLFKITLVMGSNPQVVMICGEKEVSQQCVNLGLEQAAQKLEEEYLGFLKEKKESELVIVFPKGINYASQLKLLKQLEIAAIDNTTKELKVVIKGREIFAWEREDIKKIKEAALKEQNKAVENWCREERLHALNGSNWSHTYNLHTLKVENSSLLLLQNIYLKGW